MTFLEFVDEHVVLCFLVLLVVASTLVQLARAVFGRKDSDE